MTNTLNIKGVNFFNYPAVSPDDWRGLWENLIKYLKEFTPRGEGLELLASLEERQHNITKVLGPFDCQHSPCQTEWSNALCEEFYPKLDTQSTEFFQNEELFEKIRSMDKSAFSQNQKKLAEDYLREFKNAGCGLSPVDKQRLKEVGEELVSLGVTVQGLLTKADSRVISFARDTLLGAPSEVLDELEENGFVSLAVTRTNYEMVCENVQSRAARYQMWEAFHQKNISDNSTLPLAEKMLKLRYEKARILGYENFAALNLRDKMAKAPDHVEDLLDKVWQGVLPKAYETYDKARLLALSENIDLKPWDILFYLKKAARTEGDIPKLYFDSVEKSALSAASRLFGVEFEKVSAPAYHAACQTYLVKKNGIAVGGLLTDYQKRSGKSPGAWMNEMVTQNHLFGDAPVVINVGSFYDGENRHAEISLDDAVTIFHELGHAMHGLMSNAFYPSQAGTNVVRDFVELPSQLLENWISTKAGLESAGLSPVEAQKVLDNQPDQAWDKARYLAAAFFDHHLHTDPALADLPGREWRAEILSRQGVPEWLPPHHEIERFSHVWGGGYDAGYYSYLWAEVLEADMFTLFKDDLFGQNEKARLLYSSGGTRDELELFTELLGRPPQPEALLQKMKISHPQSAPRPIKK